MLGVPKSVATINSSWSSWSIAVPEPLALFPPIHTSAVTVAPAWFKVLATLDPCKKLEALAEMLAVGATNGTGVGEESIDGFETDACAPSVPETIKSAASAPPAADKKTSIRMLPIASFLIGSPEQSEMKSAAQKGSGDTSILFYPL
jgi:hypothetical protein